MNQLVRDRKIGIMMVQESHLSKERTDSLNSKFGRNLLILNSSLGDSTNSAGVTFVINRRVLAWTELDLTEIVPGRAVLLSIARQDLDTLHILNIYAPNAPAENEQFWRDLAVKWHRDSLPSIDIMAGDFNLVESELDRLPAHPDPKHTVEALDEFKHRFTLIDGWRRTFPTMTNYTFGVGSANSQSRIDRIYLSHPLFQDSFNWDIQTPTINTDHQLVLATILDPKMPFIGKGRWTIPPNLLKDKKVKDYIQTKGKELLANMELTNEGRL
ncbi:Endonuclease/exonuclease/phosphatase [Amanita muscaria]